MKFQILIKIYDLMHDGIEGFLIKEDAEAAYKEYTGYDYPKNEEDIEDIPEKVRMTTIQEIELSAGVCPASREGEVSGKCIQRENGRESHEHRHN